MYYWRTTHQDSHDLAKSCDKCKRDGEIFKWQELPFNPIVIIKLFYVCDIEFMGAFVSSHGMKDILDAVFYVPK